MGRYDLKHIDRGIVYIPVDNNISDRALDEIMKTHKKHTVVLFRSGKHNMKNILKELIKTTCGA